MAIFNTSKTPKHRQFDYQPRYYDPEREERENRRRLKYGEDKDSPESVKGRISNSFRNLRASQRSYVGSSVRRDRSRTFILRMIIFGLLTLAVYYFLTYYLPALLS